MMTSAPRNSIPSGEIPSLNIVAVHTDRSISTGGMKARTVQPSLTWYNYHDVHPLHFSYLITIHALGIVGPMFAPFNWGTFLFGIAYGHVLGLGVTAGYHRLWAHRSYNGSVFLQYLLAAFGAGALQRDIVWWCRQHRLHHRYTDTDLDPYNAKRGFWYSHIGWLIFRQRIEPISVDVSDLKKNPVIQWQRRNYYLLVLISSFIIPGFIPWYFWGETVGGCFVYAIVVRICLLLHFASFVNSFAHWLGEATFDDKHTPRDHFITALLSFGEGYHNFHHQFPMDYRCAIKWYQFDPTKWFIWTCKMLGLASNLKTCPENEIQKSQLTMNLKALREIQEKIAWPTNTNDLPVVSWESFREQSLTRPLIVIAGFIHDVSRFIDQHPGGEELLVNMVGKDATTAFFGGVYLHSNAAHNLLAMKRVGVLHGGIEPDLDEKATPPSQHLRIIRYDEVHRHR